MIKILHISTHKTGGAGNAAYRLHLALSVENDVTSKFLYRGENTVRIKNETNVRPKKHRIHHRIANKLGIPILAWHKNRYVIEKFIGKYEKISFPNNDFKVENHPWVLEADIIHLHWISDFVNFKSFFNTLKNTPMVWTFHDMYAFKGLFHYQDDEIRNKDIFRVIDAEYKIIKRNAIEKIKRLEVVCPSAWLANIAKKSLLFKNISVIPYSLPKSWFNLLEQDQAKKKFNLAPEITTLLFVALDIDNERKGIGLLIEAIKVIPKNEIQLLVIGNRDYDFDSHTVIKTGYISNEQEMMLAYAASDIYVLPSKEDNLPNVMLEAFAQGKPVISFKNGGMAEWIKDGFNGYLCDNINAEDLAKKIMLFIEQRHTFNRKAINSFAKNHFLPSHQANAYEEVYKKLIT